MYSYLVYVYVHVYVCTYAYTCVCVYTNNIKKIFYTHTHTHTHTHIHTHTHTHTNKHTQTMLKCVNSQNFEYVDSQILNFCVCCQKENCFFRALLQNKPDIATQFWFVSDQYLGLFSKRALFLQGAFAKKTWYCNRTLVCQCHGQNIFGKYVHVEALNFKFLNPNISGLSCKRAQFR